MADAVADDLEEEGAEAPPEPVKRKRFSGKFLVLFVALPLILLLVAGLGAWKMGVFTRFMGPSKVAAQPAVFYNLPEMLVNLSSSDGRPSYLKLVVVLELDNADEIKQINKVMPRVIDAFQTELRGLRLEDLNGSEGLYRLKEDLLIRVNAAAAPAHVRNVLFKDMLVQ